ncbi:hypothetical protein OAB97_01350 [Candidatus Pelagibacter sp.]|nr:hypothetical protein [Candidatus Pelagibacter sp.]
MKNLELLNRLYFSIIFISFLFGLSVQSQEPVDIWSIDQNKPAEGTLKIDNAPKKKIPVNSIYEMQTESNTQLSIEQDETLTSKETKIVGLYDPAKNGLKIDMWNNSNGDQILEIFNRINKIDLSKDAKEILEILLLTNSYYPEKNITKKQFLEMKYDWLIKNSNINLVEKFLLSNQTNDVSSKLTRYLVDYYLSRSNIEKSCEIFSKIQNNIEDEYLSKFKIYCLINSGKKEEAQLLLDLKKELGFKDKFFEKKINYLMGYNKDPEVLISENTILEFHLSHRTNPNFKFEPKNSTSKDIWKYLSTSNLLNNTQDIELTDIDKITTIEKATHERNYSEKELYDLYKRFQFNINQLLNIKESAKVLSNVETRALIYQGILITSEVNKRIELINALKNSFKNDGLENAFDQELRYFLKQINVEEVPSNYTSFYERYAKNNESQLKNIKINNKILHQSKLINYFKNENEYKNIVKDLKDLLKKIKKNKKYFFSKKDVILIEALKSDKVKVPQKYDELYELNDSEIPSDIKVLIDNEDMGVALLRVVEFIGQDELKNIDADTIYFIVSTLNQLNVDPIRNKILLKVLPLKV